MATHSNNLVPQMLEIDWLSTFFLILSPTGVVFWIAGSWMMNRPPRKINEWVGYRTKRSMGSQEAWDYAQIFSSKVSIKMGRFLTLGGAFGIFASGIHELVQALLATFLVIYACIHLMLVTEKELKLKFS